MTSRKSSASWSARPPNPPPDTRRLPRYSARCWGPANRAGARRSGRIRRSVRRTGGRRHPQRDASLPGRLWGSTDDGREAKHDEDDYRRATQHRRASAQASSGASRVARVLGARAGSSALFVALSLWGAAQTAAPRRPLADPTAAAPPGGAARPAQLQDAPCSAPRLHGPTSCARCSRTCRWPCTAPRTATARSSSATARGGG